MNLSSLEPLSKDELQEIHLASLDVLETVGVKIEDGVTLRLLEEAGANVHYKEKAAKIPSALVEDMIKKTPSQFTLFAREPAFNLHVGTGQPFFTTGNAVEIIERGKRRKITRKDFSDFVRLVDALKNVHFCTGTNMADVPPKICDVHQIEIMANNTVKHMRPCISSVGGAKFILKMASILVGGEDALTKKPITHVGYTLLTPLRWSATSLQVFRETAKYNIPVNIESEPMSGGTSPVTLAGTLVIANAEVLSGIVLNQLYREGRPCVYSIGFAHTMDYRTAEPLTGSPEVALIVAAGAQLARYYRLPSLSWVCTDSRTVDAQSIYEKSLQFMMHILSGNDLIWGVGNLDSSYCISPEQAVMDNEVISMVNRMREGIKITEDTLALDVIRRVGIGGTFLGERHSLSHYIKEHVQADITYRHSSGTWQKMGSKSMEERAGEKAKELMETHQVVPLDRDIQQQLHEIVKEAEKWALS